MDLEENTESANKPLTLSGANEYIYMKKSHTDQDIYIEESASVKEIRDVLNATKCRSHCGTKLPYVSQRQSEQLETFVENFIKPKLSKENLKTPSIPNAKLTKDLMKRVSKKRTNFNLIILGEKGLGKSTFIEALVKNKIHANEEDGDMLPEDTILNDNKKIVERPYVLLRDGQKIYLNIIEVHDFGMALNNETALVEILDYIDKSFEESFKQECSFDRSFTNDRKIHCCLYFISPFGHSLKPLDIAFFKQFQTKINIIPIIAKCDVFTKEELRKFKSNVLKDFQKHGIDLFEYLNSSEPIDDEIDDIKEICEEIKNSVPFAVSSSTDMKQSGRNNISCREYPWGIVKTDNPDISDFVKLENILTRSHINYFKMLTKTVHYENFRMKYILERVK